MRSCTEPNARWTISTRRLHVCYELVEEFVELYRDSGGETLAQARVTPRPRHTAPPANLVHSIGAWKRPRGSETGHHAVRQVAGNFGREASADRP
jgi:hypothetical protein